jgi:LacI family transcriptional regulator
MAVNLKDIATIVGVSVSTVSLVLNGKAAKSRISEELEKKILSIAEKNNYRPNILARGLRKGTTNAIGFIISDISNALFIKLARQVEKEAMKRGYKVFFASSDDRDDQCIEAIDTFLNMKMDGLIIVPTQGIEDKIRQLKIHKVPFVLVDRYFPKIDTNYVIINNWQSSYDAVDYLIKKGKRRIATFSYETSLYHMTDRMNGYIAALKDNGINFDNRLVLKIPWSAVEYEVIMEHVRYLVEECKIDSIFFQTSWTAVTGIRALFGLNFEISKRISVICFDDNEFFPLLKPSITSLIQPVEELGIESVRILIDEIKNKRANKIKSKTMYSGRLIERDSC